MTCSSFKMFCIRKVLFMKSYFYFPLIILWMEITVKIYSFGFTSPGSYIYTGLFSISIGLFVSFFIDLVKRKFQYWITLVISFVLLGFYIFNATYYAGLKTVFSIYSKDALADASGFWQTQIIMICRTLPITLLLFIPILLYIIFHKKIFKPIIPVKYHSLRILGLSLLFYGLAIGTIFISNFGTISPMKVYADKTNPLLTVANFGLLTSYQHDFVKLIKDDKFLAADSKIAELDSYFSCNNDNTNTTNEYTGMFEGKNLILIGAESFHTFAIDEVRTPTLYKLSNSGFVFENFYTPLWWASTSDGEYVSLNSQLPRPRTLSMVHSKDRELPYNLGNQFDKIGYNTLAFHNHRYSYYKRHLTYPNMGYEFFASGLGLDIAETWPESDLEMINDTTDKYVNDEPFHIYYMSVSGHQDYNFDYNDMSILHEDVSRDTNYNTTLRAYLSCQYELELALAQLLDDLEAAGQLENTVICMFADHYPYGMSINDLKTLTGGEVANESSDFFHNTLILWSADMKEPIKIDKPCSNLDILPTLSNLFNLDYDEDYMMGQDMLNNGDGLVIFSDTSFLTRKGYYNALDDKFTSYVNLEKPDEYCKAMYEKVLEKFKISDYILLTDYFETLE